MRARFESLLMGVRRQSRTYDLGNMVAVLETIANELPQPGFIAPVAGAVGGAWLPCDGSSYSVTEYPDLFEAIEYQYGGADGSFNVPDTADLILMGNGAVVSAGETAGNASVTLGIDNLPPHGHGVVDPGHSHGFTGTPHTHGITDPGHSHSTVAGGEADETSVAGMGPTAASYSASASTSSATTGITVDEATAGGTVDDATTGISVQQTGGGASFPIIPPVLGVRFAIKT